MVGGSCIAWMVSPLFRKRIAKASGAADSKGKVSRDVSTSAAPRSKFNASDYTTFAAPRSNVKASDLTFASVAPGSRVIRASDGHTSTSAAPRRHVQASEDASTSVAPRRRVEASAASERPQVHLLSFRSCSQNASRDCNKIFMKQLASLRDIAQHYWLIDKVHTFSALPEELLHDGRFRRHIALGTRGRGYWFWKPALSLLLVRQGAIRDGDTLLWADGDLTMRKLSHAVLVVPSMRNRSLDFHIELETHCQHQWTKGDLFHRFGVVWNDPHYGFTCMPRADVWLLHVNARTRKLLQLWEDLAADWHLISDAPSNIGKNSPYYCEHRHDQAILSMLLKASDPFGRVCRKRDHSRRYSPMGLTCITKESAEVNYTYTGHQLDWRLHPEFGIPGLKVSYGNSK